MEQSSKIFFLFKKIVIVASILVGFIILVFLETSHASEENVINIHKSGFIPRTMIISQGESVVFKNNDLNSHWPASNIHPTHDIYPEFDPKVPVKPGEDWKFQFDKPGIWRFHDHLNASASGVIIVKEDLGFVNDNGGTVSLGSEIADNINFYLKNFYFKLFPKEKEKFLRDQRLQDLIINKDETRLILLLRLYEPEVLMNKLFDESENARRFNCHSYAHTLGRLSFKVSGNSVLHKYILICHSGYQHGVMAAFVQEVGELDLINEIDKNCADLDTEYKKLICFHGAGHGIMAYLNNELSEAIWKCGEFDNDFKKSNCYVGAFMENIGSWGGDSMSLHPTKWLSFEDPHYPCNKLDRDKLVQTACYAIQPNWMYSLFEGDFTKVREECSKVDEEYKLSCFFGLGQQLGAIYINNLPKLISECRKVPKEDFSYNQCILGAQRVVMDFWGVDMDKYGSEFCSMVDDDLVKYWCYERLKKRRTDLKL